MLKYFGGHPDAPNLSDEVGFVRLQGGDKREGFSPAFARLRWSCPHPASVLAGYRLAPGSLPVCTPSR